MNQASHRSAGVVAGMEESSRGMVGGSRASREVVAGMEESSRGMVRGSRASREVVAGLERGRAGADVQEKIVRSRLFCSAVKASIARQ